MVAHKRADRLYNSYRVGVPLCFTAGEKISNGPQVGPLATGPLPSWGVPLASVLGTKSEMAHNWANWLHSLCRLGGPQRFRVGNKITNGPQLGRLAT